MRGDATYSDPSAVLNILAELDDLVDIVRCATVCKAWNAACQQLQPVSLYISADVYSRITFKPGGLVSILKWLQCMNSKGAFGKLRRLLVTIDYDDCTAECHKRGSPQLFSQSVVTLAGSWHLQRCLLTLHSPLDIAASLLPATLRHLVLELRTVVLASNVSLSLFEALTGLEKLELQLRSKEPADFLTKRQQTARFVLDTKFDFLTSLSLSPWLLQCSPGRTVSHLLPKLDNLNVCVQSTQAQSMLDLSTLQTLALSILCFNIQDQYERLKVQNPSQLRFLKLASSTTNHISMVVNNAHVQYHTDGISCVTTRFAERIHLDDDGFHGALSP